MNASYKAPIYNLKAVLQETGLKPDTIRAWQRRYGLPKPGRSAGGHRLYSQHDIDTLKWLVARQEEGLSISKAVDLWKQLEAEGRNPLEYASIETRSVRISPTVGTTIAELRQEWTSACLNFDEQAAERVLAHAFALYPPELVCTEVLQSGLAQLGEGWYRGQVTVQQEHFASELAHRRLETLIAASPAPTRPERFLIACPPQEDHTFSALLLTFMLRRQGRDVVYLGANVPLENLERALDITRPHLVILPAQQLHTAATLFEISWALRTLGFPPAFGGLVFNLLPDLRTRIPGYFLGERLEEASLTALRLATSHQEPPPGQMTPPIYQQALLHYRERLPMLEAYISQQALSWVALSYEQLIGINRYFSQNVAAALILGDINLLGTEIAWVQGLISYHINNVPSNTLQHYLQAYYRAARTYLDERGEPLTAWLARLTGFQGG